ncbi:hypothetical protein IEQ34_020686 [Dendrobium chrysotoxum]|uniref:Uncharacterized protein n=1 Tax=Dendrobium chrysotoxum TaxID=161865 RepID=A0AAV7G1P1_DENCH|nr:hypothetical protein IEQ34_020686 [Dendrobium chrysotoxum]
MNQYFNGGSLDTKPASCDFPNHQRSVSIPLASPPSSLICTHSGWQRTEKQRNLSGSTQPEASTTQSSSNGSISRPNTPHSIRSLLIKEFKKTDNAEDLSYSNKTVLNQQPVSTQIRHWSQEKSLISMLDGIVSSIRLEKTSPCCGEYRYGEAKANSLKLGYTLRVPGDSAGKSSAMAWAAHNCQVVWTTGHNGID